MPLFKEEKRLTSTISEPNKSLQTSEPSPDEKRKQKSRKEQNQRLRLCITISEQSPWSWQNPVGAIRLLDILTKKSSFQNSFISIPEIQARNKVLKHSGLPDEEYLVLFIPNYKYVMMLVGESYPFIRGNFCMTVIAEENDNGICELQGLESDLRAGNLASFLGRSVSTPDRGCFLYGGCQWDPNLNALGVGSSYEFMARSAWCNGIGPAEPHLPQARFCVVQPW